MIGGKTIVLRNPADVYSSSVWSEGYYSCVFSAVRVFYQ